MREGTRERKAQEKADHVARMAKIEATRRATAKQVARRDDRRVRRRYDRHERRERHSCHEVRPTDEATGSVAAGTFRNRVSQHTPLA
jgi:hypothetical protein